MKFKDSRLAPFLLGACLAVLTMLPVGEAMFSRRLKFDPALGLVPRPDRVVASRLEGNGRALYTEHQIRRDRLPATNEHPVILVMGDSFTEALQVKDADTYVYRLEASLRRSGVPAAVLNAGASGRTLAYGVGMAETYQRLFAPDWLVFQLSTNSFARALDPGESPHFQTNQNTHRLEVSALPPPTRTRPQRALDLARDAGGDVCTFAYAQHRLEEFLWWVRLEKPWFHAAGSPPGAGVSLPERHLPIAEELELLRRAWRGRVTLFFIAPFDPTGPTRQDPVEQEVARVARQMGLSVARLDQHFGTLPRGVSPFGFDNLGYNTGHLNPFGHRLAAEVLAEELKRVAATNGLF